MYFIFYFTARKILFDPTFHYLFVNLSVICTLFFTTKNIFVQILSKPFTFVYLKLQSSNAIFRSEKEANSNKITQTHIKTYCSCVILMIRVAPS